MAAAACLEISWCSLSAAILGIEGVEGSWLVSGGEGEGEGEGDDCEWECERDCDRLLEDE